MAGIVNKVYYSPSSSPFPLHNGFNLSSSLCNFPAISIAARVVAPQSFQNRGNQSCREFHKHQLLLQLPSSTG